VLQQGEHVGMTETSASWSELAARHPDIAVERLVVTSLAANCYLLTCQATGELIVVDAGDDGPRILDRIDQVTGGARERVRLIINTHGHFDHVAAVADVRAALGAVPVLMHPDDIELVEGNGPDVLRMLRREYVPVLPDGLLLEGDEVRWGACALRVIATPGHSPGGICLYGHGLLISGDTLFRRGVGAWRFFRGSKEALFDSLRRKVLTLPPETVVYPGHGEPTTIGEEVAENPYVKRTED
jgi:hydroxyacylglutathione hydrolase